MALRSHTLKPRVAPARAVRLSSRGSSLALAPRPHAAVRLALPQRQQRWVPLRVSAVGGGVAEGEERSEQSSEDWRHRVVVPTMASIGSQLGGTATLEKSGISFEQASEQQSSAKLDQGDGGGGLGNGIFNGGGGDGDEGDDDDYYDEDGDEEGDEGFLSVRQAVEEQFDRNAIDAVLQEWFKTLADLPSGIRMAVEMGLVSSWQIARFMSVDCRPTLVRAVSRSFPSSVSRAFVGRLLADPAFLFKVGVEQLITVGSAVVYESKQRGSRLRQEWDLALTNVLTLSAANLALVWMLAPCRSYGVAHKSSLTRILHDLPNNVFDREGPLRTYTKATRALSAVVKAAELSLVGMVAGASGSVVSNGLVALRRTKDPSFEPALPVPAPQQAALAMGAHLGFFSNFRYQLIGGMDRWMQMMLASLPTHLVCTSSVRFLNTQVGDQTRLHWLGLPREAPVSAASAASPGLLVAAIAAAKKAKKSATSSKKKSSAAAKKTKKSKAKKTSKKTATTASSDRAVPAA